MAISGLNLLLFDFVLDINYDMMKFWPVNPYKSKLIKTFLLKFTRYFVAVFIKDFFEKLSFYHRVGNLQKCFALKMIFLRTLRM